MRPWVVMMLNDKVVMHMYDKDDKLLCASENQIRLWDFWDQKESAPELIT